MPSMSIHPILAGQASQPEVIEVMSAVFSLQVPNAIFQLRFVHSPRS